MRFQYDDGGRAAGGYKGSARDCAARAIAIATQAPYRQVYADLNALAGKPVARTGVPKAVSKKYMARLGWIWTPAMAIGSGCKTRLRADDLPSGRLVVSCSRHLAAVVDGVLRDVYDSSRGESRCVYGYWREP